VVFDNASHVSLVGVSVANSAFAGIVIEGSSSNIEIAGDTVAYSSEGIDIMSGAGADDLIEGNSILSNAGAGIGISDVTDTSADAAVIAGNLIIDNGAHGIELTGNGITVENNIIYGNGTTTSGTSGIHVYATSATQGMGQFNIIRYNLVMDQQELTAQDGNGIELDQWTSGNQVIGNLTNGNDGAGIILYDSSNNLVQDNTLIGDDVDPGHSHGLPGELVLSSAFSTSLTTANTVLDNTAMATGANDFAVLVDAATTAQSNTIGSNAFANYGGGAVYSWDYTPGSSLSAWNSKPKGGGVDSFTL
jgi:parallel beta-helix repeat protein